MTGFAEHVRKRGARSLATFGDSITEGMSASAPEKRWANLLATFLRVDRLANKGIAGTVMQQSPMADGKPKPNSGRARYERDLLGSDRADVIAILYGFNDARYIGAPETFHHANFVRDYKEVLAGLFAAGYRPEDICIGSPPHIPDAGFHVGTAGFTGQTREAFQAYVETVKQIAREAGTFYAPVNERMGAEGGDLLLSEDHVHPNDAGHAKIAEIFADATRLGGYGARSNRAEGPRNAKQSAA
ncbi:SGNH/GDSL hydrolase family protein [Chelativorans sp.]|uniref:SGNH/GDSL hydrolase family protein n=1 Tax=Chelativorans sp. TaxID=2203393 RepID=UPI0028121E61|nr:SGNH/GDSL hydrolase family protein [Chelativorans sp.]